jgi:ribosomal protein S27AE
MNIQSVFPAPSKAKLSRPTCPRCGSIVLMAERAALDRDSCVRHAWCCDQCGHEFVTSTKMPGHQFWHNINN